MDDPADSLIWKTYLRELNKCPFGLKLAYLLLAGIWLDYSYRVWFLNGFFKKTCG